MKKAFALLLKDVYLLLTNIKHYRCFHTEHKGVSEWFDAYWKVRESRAMASAVTGSKPFVDTGATTAVTNPTSEVWLERQAPLTDPP